MKNILFILALFPVVLFGQLTPADEISPFSNTGDSQMYINFTRLNLSDAFLKTLTDSSKAIFNYEDSAIHLLLYIDYKLTDGWSMAEGRAGWNDDDKTLEVGLDQGSVLQMGQEIHVRGTNKYGATLYNGTPVIISGAQGNRPTFGRASDTSVLTSLTTIGLTTHDIVNNTNGYVTITGIVRDIPDSMFITLDAIADGELLWLGNGLLSDIRPPAPNMQIAFGFVINTQGDNVDVIIDPVLVPRMAWQSDVNARGNQINWDLLYWNADSSYWDLSDGLIEADSVVIRVLDFENGATIINSEPDTLFITETVTTIDGELKITGHVYEGEHASGLAYISTPGTQTIETGGTFERLNEGAIAYTGAHLHEFTHSDGRLTYTSVTPISLTVNATISVESAEVVQEIQFRIAQNGTTIAGTTMQVEFNAVNGNAALPLLWAVDMEQNDYVEVWGTSDTNGDQFILNNLTLFIAKH